MIRASRLRKLGWALVLLTCSSLYLALHLRVNAVKSDVRLAERRIVDLERQNSLLETEFETRSNQHQLGIWNEVDFGYQAPKADQFLEGERQLAQLGTPREKGAPEPIMVASAPTLEDQKSAFSSLLATSAVAAEVPKGQAPRPRQGDFLSARLERRPAARVMLDAQEGGHK